MNEDQDAAAKALYERNTNGSAPRWEQLGEITKTVWREELDRRDAAAGVPGTETTECPRCRGQGSYTSDYHVTIQCPRCSGTGRIAAVNGGGNG